jgi:hypothetical protein
MSLFWFWNWRRYWNLPLHESKHVRSEKPTIWNRPEISYCALDDVEEMRRKSALTYRLQINPTIGQSWMKSFEGSQLLWPENKEWMTTKDTILIPSHWCHFCAIEVFCDSKFEVTWMLKIKRNANTECLRNKKWRTRNDEPCFIPSQQEACHLLLLNEEQYVNFDQSK